MIRAFRFSYGISCLALAAATDDGAAAPSPKPRNRRKSDAKPAAAPAPTVAAAEGATSVSEATQKATTDENQASTTRADDPARDSTFSATTTAESLEGVEQKPNSNDEGGAGTAGGASAIDNDMADEATAGNRHSHPAETTAERTTRLFEANGDATGPGPELLAGESADPAKAAEFKPAEDESSQDESGALQDATRDAIGAGTGAVDGVAGGGADPVEADVNAQVDAERGEEDSGASVEVANGERINGTRAKLYRLLEKGATHEQMLKVTGYRSALGTATELARMDGRELVPTKDAKGVKTYKLAPRPEAE